MKRRLFLQISLTGAQIALALGAGLLRPTQALADWPADAFDAERLDEALALLTGGATIDASDAVTIEAEDIAENGATVPLVVRSRLPGTRTLFLFAEKNPTPALSRFELSPRVESAIDTRVKLAKTGPVIAVVYADGGYFSASKQIQVMTGSCS